MDMFAATNKGRAEGAEQMAKLVKILIDNESYDELKQIDDENYRSYLFEKYKIEHKFGKSIDR